MKIGFVTPGYAPYRGGVETLVQAIASRLCRDGHRIEVLTLDASGNLPQVEDMGGVLVRRFRERAPGGIYHVGLSLLAHMASHRDDYDIVNAHNYHAMP